MAPPVEDPSSEVELADVPAALFIASQNHQHDLLRELSLMDIGDRWGLTDQQLPQRLAMMIAEILADYADVRTATRHQALAALERGEETVTIRVPARPGIADALRRWLQLVEQADDFCSQGLLLTLPAPAEVRTLRRWYVEAIDEGLRDGDGRDLRRRVRRPGP